MTPAQPNPFRSVEQALFQASMFRQYAMDFNGTDMFSKQRQGWLKNVLGLTREDCIRKAREALSWAKQMQGGAS